MNTITLDQFIEERRPIKHLQQCILYYYNIQVGYEGIRFNPLFNKFEYNTNMIEDQVNSSEANELLSITQVLRYTSYTLDYKASSQEMIYQFGRWNKTTLKVILDFDKGLVRFESNKIKTKIKFNNLKSIVGVLETLNICLHKDSSK